MDWMLEETKAAVLVAPIVIAMAMVARENASRSRSDLLRRLEAPLGHTVLQLLEPEAHPVHRLAALGTFKGLAFFGMDDEDPHAGLV